MESDVSQSQEQSNEIASCRSCYARELVPILSLGRTPLANSLRTAEQLKLPEPTFPLDVVFCPRCTLVQITETIPPEQLFREYAYFSSFSDTMLRHVEDLAIRLRRERSLNAASLAVEVASNDGYLLQFYQRAGVPVLGIEPARNIARVAQERGIATVCDFFNAAVANRLVQEGYRADVLHANNVLAHVADLNGFVAGFRLLLKPNGVAVIETPYVKDLLDKVEFDTIYHEHLCYYSLTALVQLFERHGLQIVDVERVSIHGGSLRLFVMHAGTNPPSSSVVSLLSAEAKWVAAPDIYLQFAKRVATLREELTKLLRRLKAAGKRIAAYGASAKGSTLLNYCGIGRNELDYVVDRSTVKQGLYSPGTGLLIHDPRRLIEDRPDFVLLLTWNFAEEILLQQSEYRKLGGQFIIPVPDVTLA